jgi:hypothetical protein
MRLERFLLIAVALVAACKPPTPAERMDSIQSWLGTAAMVGDAWLNHTTPDRYSRQTLELSNENLLQICEELLKSPPPGIDSDSLQVVLARARGHIARMARLIGARNSSGFARQLDSLRADGRMVKWLADDIESKR